MRSAELTRDRARAFSKLRLSKYRVSVSPIAEAFPSQISRQSACAVLHKTQAALSDARISLVRGERKGPFPLLVISRAFVRSPWMRHYVDFSSGCLHDLAVALESMREASNTLCDIPHEAAAFRSVIADDSRSSIIYLASGGMRHASNYSFSLSFSQ